LQKPLSAFSRAILSLPLAAYARTCATRIISTGGQLVQSSTGKPTYPTRIDLRTEHTQYDVALGRTVRTTVRVRVTVEVEGWESSTSG